MSRIAVLFALIGLLAGTPLLAAETAAVPSQVPVKGMVTMLDIGSDKCLPCKMMAPIMEELEKEYAGKAAILFLDVWRNTGEAVKYEISVIPTQIFYDKDGNEVGRHEGFLNKREIVARLGMLGAE